MSYRLDEEDESITWLYLYHWLNDYHATDRMTKKLDRREKILNVALEIAARVGYSNVERQEVAIGAECSAALISYHFSTMTQFKRAIMRAAVHKEDAKVVAQGLAANDPIAVKAPALLKAQAATLLLN